MGFLSWCDEKLGGVDEAIGGAASSVAGAVSDAAGVVRDDVGSLLGFDTRAENVQQEQAAAAKREGQQLREQLAEQNRRLDAPGGYDPASIKQQENWQTYEHRRIYDTNQSSLNQGDAAEVAEGWRSIGKELGEIGERLQQRSSKAITSGWSGQAADAAKQSGEPLVDWMRGSGECFRLTGNKIEQAGSAAGQVKGMVPPPQEHDMSRAVVASIATGPAGAGMDGLRQMREQQQAERHAQETMGRVMGATYQDVDSTVPAYKQLDGKPAPPPPPPPPAEPPPVPAAIPPGRSGNGNVGSGDTGGSSSVPPNGQSGWNGPGQPGGNQPGQPGQPGGNGPQPGQPGWNQPGQSPRGPAGSESAWYPDGPGGAPGTPGGPGSSGAGGAVSGRGVGGGAPGGGYVAGGMPGGTPSGQSTPPGGRSGTAPVKGAPSTPGTSATGNTTSGRGPGGRMPMGGMGGQNRQGGEEEHERESWLVEQEDVWLNDLDKTAPPVIGLAPWEQEG